MRTIVRLLTAGLIPIVATGCGLTGQWASTELEPEMARNQFRLFGEPGHGLNFTKATVTLHDDKTYSAEVHYGEHLHQSTGKWESTDANKMKGKLTFVDSQGITQTYDYTLSGDHKTLTISRPIEGTDVKLILKRM